MNLYKLLDSAFKCKHPKKSRVQVLAGQFYCDKCQEKVIYNIDKYLSNEYLKINNEKEFNEIFKKQIAIKYKEHFGNRSPYSLSKREYSSWESVLSVIAQRMYNKTDCTLLKKVGIVSKHNYYFNILPEIDFKANTLKFEKDV